MKVTRCTKCGGREKWIIDPYRLPFSPRAGLTMEPLQLSPRHPVPGRFGAIERDIGTLRLELCAACGFAELWGQGFEDLVETEDGRVRRAVADEDVGAPYR